MKELTKEEKDLLYYNNHVRHSFQWELWSLCNQKCKFCYLGDYHNAELCDEEKQLSSLSELNQAIDCLDFTLYNNISLIGGEFFQGECRSEKVKKAFFDTCVRIGQLYKDHKIGSFWLTVTLTSVKQDGLYELLNYFEDNDMLIPDPDYGASGLWLCTSWDPEGRFHNLAQSQHWEDHMKNLTNHYPWVKKSCTCILMEPLVEQIVSGGFSYQDFRRKYNTTLFFKPSGVPQGFMCVEDFLNEEEIDEFKNKYGENDNEFYKNYPDRFLGDYLIQKQRTNERLGIKMFPRRELVIQMLSKIYHEDKEWYDRLFNIRYRADELHRNFKPEMHDEFRPRDKHSRNQDPTYPPHKILPCGHDYDYAAYVDSECKCFLCDKMMIEESEG